MCSGIAGIVLAKVNNSRQTNYTATECIKWVSTWAQASKHRNKLTFWEQYESSKAFLVRAPTEAFKKAPRCTVGETTVQGKGSQADTSWGLGQTPNIPTW